MNAILAIIVLTVQVATQFVFGVEGQGQVSVLVSSDLSSTEDLSSISVEDVTVLLSCRSPSSSTEWVLDDDITGLTSPKFPCTRVEWTQRWDGEGDVFRALLRLKCSTISSKLEIGCRAADNHSDAMLVRLEPNQATGRTTIRKHHITSLEIDEVLQTQQEDQKCSVSFTVAQTANEHYWRCEEADPDGLRKKGVVEFLNCGDGSFYCDNIQRKLKAMPVCHTVIRNLTSAQITGASTWTKYSQTRFNTAGVAVCKLKDTDGESAYAKGAVEFFFVGKQRWKPYFSMSEISVDDLIWFDPQPSSLRLYTRDVLKMKCVMPEHWFSFDPTATISFNNSILEFTKLDYSENDFQFVKKVELPLEERGPGYYKIECRGPVRKTTEWAEQKISLEVANSVAPYFATDFEDVEFEEGDERKVLECDVEGDPTPVTSWEQAAAGLRSEGRQLVLTRRLAEWAAASSISCTAANRFGERARKVFKIQLNQPPAGGASSDTAVSSTTIAAIVVVPLILIILLALGLGVLYFKFVRFGRAVAQVLSDEEVKKFYQGIPESGAADVGNGTEQLVIDCLPYNAEYEVTKDKIAVDFSLELGSGQYGVVYMGHIKDGSNPITVAVKTVRPNVPIEYFKALLSELKILAYIRHHENVAKLVGAYSSNIKNRELFVGVEFCKTSLLQHLRDNSKTFKLKTVSLTVETFLNEYENSSQKLGMTEWDLIRWSCEIAAGMEYLSGKRIVHGDLAARNVLLSFENRAKICDFGLARQLVDYTYIKSTKCNLPWKWMAIESLRQMHFSTASDVWAYGVTCWEIFSLGDIPYPCLGWSWEFVVGLVAGNRLAKPEHASSLIYSIMLQCWAAEKEARPKFDDLRQFFEAQQRQNDNAGSYTNMV